MGDSEEIEEPAVLTFKQAKDLVKKLNKKFGLEVDLWVQDKEKYGDRCSYKDFSDDYVPPFPWLFEYKRGLGSKAMIGDICDPITDWLLENGATEVKIAIQDYFWSVK